MKTDKSRRNFFQKCIGSVALLSVGSAFTCKSNKEKSKTNPYEYDLSALKKVDPKWLTWAEMEPISLTLDSLFGLATDSEKRIVVTGDQVLILIAPSGKELKRIALDHPAKCVTVSPDGKIYLGMTDHVEVYDLEGSRLMRWEALNREAIITSVAATETDVFAADAGNKIILRYDTLGSLTGRIGDKDPAKDIPGFIIPSPYFDVAIGYEGNLWAANTGLHTLENYTADGHLRSSWGKPSYGIHGFCGCCNPSHFAIFSDGRFVTSEKGLPRIKVYSQNGELEAVAAGPDQFDEGTVGLDLAVDSQGRILVLDPKRKMIRIFQKTEPT